MQGIRNSMAPNQSNWRVRSSGFIFPHSQDISCTDGRGNGARGGKKLAITAREGGKETCNGPKPSNFPTFTTEHQQE